MRRLLFALGMIASVAASGASFDHQHKPWDALVERHVTWVSDHTASVVDYAGFREDRPTLNQYLASLSQVSESQYQSWGPDQQLAFLINAYNAFTVKLILSEYPQLDSIKDLGGLFTSPWDKAFFELRGQQRTLDELEHEMIRVEFNEPRIHMAVNCASVGCPALADEAYVAGRLDSQLDAAVRAFLSDASRNRYAPDTNTFAVSSIFDWYGEDWNEASGYPNGVRGFLWQYRSAFETPPTDQSDTLNATLRFLDYDWALNDNDQS
ncbi:uncharacterized protein DUF547 [Tamilnaduibacter salinus]|uniref:DUF547 domain-containing protein n=1 Tax=Tamilnaduibacter salinus TaxID=1484056 RepID=A0A2A2HZY4_9GAMM|nr:DUF547 domain-containing protein [Tamilnaduibacter salinus]PAV24718.1 DUF547 domain-containing protein [Tamilnaduibacter salinus]PVY77382.1 uncharacterized protein DUF547 [Tamilnaduibacter salinus]